MLRNLLKRLIPSGTDPAAVEADRLIAIGRKAEDDGDLREACDRYRDAVAAAPMHPAAHLNLGVGLEAMGDVAAALACYETVLALDRQNAYANYNLGKLYFIRRSYARAEGHLKAALKTNPKFPEALVVLAGVKEEKGDYDEAAHALREAVRLRPMYAGAWHNYAIVLLKLNRMADVEEAAREAIRCDPGFLGAYRLLGDLLRTDGRLEEAVEMFKRARVVQGGDLACDQAQLHALNYFDGISDEVLFEKHCEVGRQIEKAHPARFAPFRNPRDPERRLRIGYVSRDFFRHPVAWFMAPVIDWHDRSGFEAYCYATTARNDDVTAQLRSAADRWVDLSRMTHSQMADTINRDGVDILVDLLGHAGSSDLVVFAQQPAPVQVTWLGYLNTTGLTRMHYRLCDAITDPPGIAERLHTEALVRLPHSQWCYRPYRELELSADHATQPPCLRNGFATFGSFHHRIKLSASVLALWTRILNRLPDSRLLIMGVPTGPARERLLERFAAEGIAAARIEIVPPVSMNDYFPYFDEVDIALDSTPYSGGTTTCDTLWMGVPVVTLASTRSVSRSAASLLTTVGLADWIALTPDEYVDLAVQFARQPALLAELRQSLRNRMKASSLMDEGQFVRDLEAAYRQMWRDWCGRVA